MPTASEIERAVASSLLKRSHEAAAIFVEPSNARSYGCRVVGCVRKAYASELCNAHYIRARKGRPLENPVRARKRGDCCVECGNPTGAKGGWGMCTKHYRRARYTTIKATLVEALGGKCSRCAGAFPLAAFDFHHLADKEDAPSSMLLNASVRAIAREVGKCVLMCANCHRITHGEQFR